MAGRQVLNVWPAELVQKLVQRHLVQKKVRVAAARNAT